ncbi:LysM peptidoglycan-binding domain-containing protein [Propioniciclava soli]|uniref:LysM peptidoglycan-binding domain-containing protein n=1 Tax=Propioniciclava soli TaxID=2775081 RepID=UPI001E324EF6|nr:LysM peptidoglycan-binding domain-containing protein [Propioniciclava soli]
MRKRISGLAATFTIAVILVGLPVVLVGVGVPTVLSPPYGNPLDALLRPDDGTLVLAGLWVIGCLVWVVFTLLTLTELVAAVRRVRAPQITGLRVPQALARQLVSTAALLFVATNSVVGVAEAAPSTNTVSTIEVADSTPNEDVVPEPVAEAAPATALAATEVTYVVQPGDSLWRIAERELGTADRFPEIVALNGQLLSNGPDFLEPGWELLLPAEAPGPTGGQVQVTVERGDTLSKLAAAHLGDATSWPDIYAASTAITQPDGRHLVDPDQIDIGWTLAIPDPVDQQPQPVADDGPNPRSGPELSAPAPTAEPAPIQADPQPSADTSTDDATVTAPVAAPADAAPNADDAVTTQDHDAPGGAPMAGWIVPGLAAGGLLVGALGIALGRRRAIQARFRRPGKAIPAAPAELAPIEKTVAASPAAAASGHMLDRVLSWTATQQLQAGRTVPPLVALDMDAEKITLHLAEDDELLAPWRGDATGTHWTLQLSEAPDQDALTGGSGTPAWPQLVTIGTGDTGATWLLNAEEMGTLRLSGDPTYVEDFTRYLVAELALNPWAQDVRVDCINTCSELTAIDSNRVRHHTTAAAVTDALAEAVHTADRLAEADVADLGDARAGDAGDDLWVSRTVVIAHPATPELDVLMDTIASQPGRTGTSVILTGPAGSTHGVEIHLTPSGRVQLPEVGLDLIAVGLTQDEAAGCAALIAFADQTDDADIPPMEPAAGQDTWRSYANEAGQITDPRVTGRHPSGQDDASIIPEADATIVAHAAATVEDLDTLAPTIPDDVAVEVQVIDPTLDEDLAEWKAGGPRPRLSVLGPVTARTGTGGNAQAVIRRKPYYTELLCYLASRPNGARTDQVADAMNIDPKRVRRDLSVLRDWLGTDPATSQPHVPEATKSNAAKLLGGGAYEVNGLLYDADLFRRLRLRGQARGPEGLADLIEALSLVNGRPFDQIRSGGGVWLIDQNLPHYLTAAIVDVAHMVTTISLTRGNYRAARAAAETAILAAPHEQIPRLDLAAVASAEGLTHEAQRIARTAIDGDGDEAPLELSDRANEILGRHPWLDRAEAS